MMQPCKFTCASLVLHIMHLQTFANLADMLSCHFKMWLGTSGQLLRLGDGVQVVGSDFPTKHRNRSITKYAGVVFFS